MRKLFLTALSVAVAFTAVAPDRMLSLEHSSIHYYTPTDELLLSATWCEDETQVFLNSNGTIHNMDTSKIFPLSTASLFINELSTHSAIAFLKPYYDLIAWGSLRDDGNLLSCALIFHLPRSFWRSIKPTEIPHLIAHLGTYEILAFLRLFREENVQLHRFVIFSPLSGECYEVEAGTSLKQDQALVTVDGEKTTTATFAKDPIILLAKLFTDDDRASENQPLYLYIRI